MQLLGTLDFVQIEVGGRRGDLGRRRGHPTCCPLVKRFLTSSSLLEVPPLAALFPFLQPGEAPRGPRTRRRDPLGVLLEDYLSRGVAETRPTVQLRCTHLSYPLNVAGKQPKISSRVHAALRCAMIARR